MKRKAATAFAPTGRLQQLTHEMRTSIATDLSGRWESYSVSATPINWRFSSGDGIEISVEPTGDRPDDGI